MYSTSSSESDFEVLDWISDISVPRNMRNKRDAFEMYTDDEFKMRYRFDKNSVMHLNDIISPVLAPVTYRENTLSVVEQIIIALRFYATGTFKVVIGDDITVHKTTASRVIYKVSTEIAKLSKTYITMPTHEELGNVKEQFYNIAGFPNVIGCVGGAHVRILSPGGAKAENFRNKQGFFSINTQVVCDANLYIRHIDAQWGGSAPDSEVYQNSVVQEYLVNNEIDGHLLGNSAYPCSKHMMTPILNPKTDSEQWYNDAHTQTRNAIERTLSIWKGRFPCLSQILRLKLDHTLTVIVATAVLHNIGLLSNDTTVIDTPEVETTVTNSVEHPISLEGNHYRKLLLDQYFR